MPNKSKAVVRQQRPTDIRSVRSAKAIARAIVALLQEQSFEQLTVGKITRCAGIGRTTFYSHYRNKHDALASSYERLFDLLETQIGYGAHQQRLAPLAELASHFAQIEPALAGLRQSGNLDRMWDLAVAYIARIIQRRFVRVGPRATALPPRLVARMLAATAIEILRWWSTQVSRPPEKDIDRAFHAVARGVLEQTGYRIVPRAV
jgi:AcrR family transcriptional regulator